MSGDIKHTHTRSNVSVLPVHNCVCVASCCRSVTRLRIDVEYFVLAMNDRSVRRVSGIRVISLHSILSEADGYSIHTHARTDLWLMQ